MSIRFAGGGPQLPMDVPTHADLYTLPASVRRHGWGVRIPHSKTAARKAQGSPFQRGSVIVVFRADGGTDNKILEKQLHANRDFTYWTTTDTKRTGATR